MSIDQFPIRTHKRHRRFIRSHIDKLIILFVTLLLIGCAKPGSDGDSDGDGGGVPVPQGPELDLWSYGTNLNTARTYHASVASSASPDAYLYVFGGVGLGSVEYAKINSDGSLGAWTTTTALPFTRLQASSVAYNGYVYVIGGTATTGGAAENTVYYTSINSTDGSLDSPWQTTSTLFAPRKNHVCVIYDDGVDAYVYAIGGTPPEEQSMDYAKINTDGTLGTWQNSGQSLTNSYQFHSAAAYDGYLYVIGGADTPPLKQVEYAKIGTGHDVESWIEDNGSAIALPTPARRSHTSMVYNGYIYILGGTNDGSTPLGGVYYAQINTDHSVADQWILTATLKTARFAQGGAIHEYHVFVTGGNSPFLATTEYTSFK